MVSAQIKVGQELVKPKSINVFKDGQWQEKRAGYVFKSGEWVPFIKYTETIYDNGIEYLSFSRGLNSLSTFEKLATELYLMTRGNSERYNVAGTVVTGALVDLTSISYVDVIWYNDGFSHSNNSSFLFATTNAMDHPMVTQLYLKKGGPFSVTTDTLDVRELTGSYYIGFGTQADSTSTSDRSQLHVKKIELR